MFESTGAGRDPITGKVLQVSTANSEKIRGRARSVLKGVYYSRTFRAVAYAPLDALRTDQRPPRSADAAAAPAVRRPGRRLRGGRRRLARPARPRSRPATGFRRPRRRLRVGRAAVALIPQLPSGTYEGFDIVPQFIRWCRREITSRHPNFGFQLADVQNRQYNRNGGRPAPVSSSRSPTPASTSPSRRRCSPTWSPTAFAAT